MNNDTSKQYGGRNPMKLDRKGGYFSRHMNAMTEEDLSAKGEIACELAWRDMEIDRLRKIENSLIERFSSSNGVEVDRAIITRKQFCDMMETDQNS